MFVIGLQPAKSALMSGVLALFAGLILRSTKISFSMLMSFFERVSNTLIPIILIGGAAGIIVGVLNITGLGFNLTLGLAEIGNQYGLLVMLLLTGVIAIILGMGMPTAAVYIVLSVVLAPAVIEMGVPVLAAHLFIFYFGLLSMITPPVAVASFVAAGIADASIWRTSFTAIKLGIAAYFLPFLFVYNDSLLLKGSWFEILLVFLTCLVSGLMIASALREENFRSVIGAIRMLGSIILSLTVGSATLWLGRDSSGVFMVIFIGAIIYLGLHKIKSN
jgi:TRAP-type uncharacterized transport system fused permease subunit